MTKIVITGSSGLIGSALSAELTHPQFEICRLIRRRNSLGSGSVYWNPTSGELDSKVLEGCDAMFHFAGENIASRRWNKNQMTAIRQSRIAGSELLIRSSHKRQDSPKLIVVASAIGFYGSRGAEILDESSSAGEGFLASVCQDVEQVWSAANLASSRLVFARFGVVLHPAGGALAKMLPQFRLGLGGPCSNGEQWMSWISLQDASRALMHILEHQEIRGPVNIVCPHPLKNSDFSLVLASTMNRPSLFRTPKWLIELLFGQMARETILASTRVIPTKLSQNGFEYQHTDLHNTLSAMIRNN